MKALSVILLIAIIILFSGCVSKPLFKKTQITTLPPPDTHTAIINDRNPASIEISRSDYWRERIRAFINKYQTLLLTISALLMTWLAYRTSRSNKKQIDLDEDDIETLGLAADSLNDFLYRIKSKNKSQVVQFPRGD